MGVDFIVTLDFAFDFQWLR